MKIVISNSTNNNILDNRYIILKKVDFGATSSLYQVLDTQTNEIKAAKVFSEGKNIEFQQELNILNSIPDSPFIIKYYSSGEGPLIMEETVKRKYVILEYANNSLFKIRQSMNTISEDTCKYIFYQIILAIKSLHEKGICHRDIKLENILFVGDNYNLKLCDFGYSTSLFDSNNNKIKLNDMAGSPYHFAPEILVYRPYDGEKIDIFCAGVTLYSLMIGRFGFYEASRNDDLYKLIMKKKYDEYWDILDKDKKLSNEFKELYIKMVSYVPKERPSIDQIINCEWLKDIREANEEKLKYYQTKMINELKGE